MTAAVTLKSGVYAIIHKDSGKRYIGSSKNVLQRLRYHTSHLRGNSHFNDVLQHAWNKYGEDAFERHQVLVCIPEDRLFYEQLLMDGYKTLDRQFGYNLSLKAESPTHSPETIQKIKIAVAKARARGKMGHHKPHSEEARKRMSEIKKGKPLLARRGIFHTEEAKKKMSIALKGRTVWNKGKKLSAEHIRKNQETRRAQFKDPVFLEKWNARKITHCKRGHPFSGDNLHILPDGERVCRTCSRKRVLKHRSIHPRRRGT